jgi:excisionase family DNA binding protein
MLKIGELAELWNCSRAYIRKLIDDEGLPTYKYADDHRAPRRIRLAEAEEWLRERREVKSA